MARFGARVDVRFRQDRRAAGTYRRDDDPADRISRAGARFPAELPAMTEPIDYIELPGGDLEATTAFYANAFGWSFTSYGPDYAGIEGAGVDGGFDRTAPVGAPPLVIVKSDDLEATLANVEAAGAEIVRPTYSFPGGRRFHFRDPAGNVLAVWGE
jgi:predicted enzyme related to lactoylglutathione lyase